MSERMSRRDAVFFQLETRTTPYHMASLLLCEGPAPSDEELARVIEDRIELMPRFRQRVHTEPFTRRLEWRDDDGFDIGYHVRRTSLREPGGTEQLKRLVGELMASHLNRHRPLWELWVIDGIQGGGWGMLLKAHHATVDGTTGAHDLAVMFGNTAAPSGEEPGRVRRVPTLRGLASASLDLARGSVPAVADMLRPAPRTPFNRAIGPNRVFESAGVALDDLKEIKDAHGATINDVVLAAVAGSLRTWLEHRAQDLTDLELRALVPVSLRGDMDALSGNLVGGVLAPLPVSDPDPTSRLRAINAAMHGPALRSKAVASGLLLQVPAWLPRGGTGIVTLAQQHQRSFNLSLPNIRGPENPLQVAGRRVTGIVPIPPLSANAGLIVCAMSYAGSMSFGLLADPRLVWDLHLIAEGIEKSVIELME